MKITLGQINPIIGDVKHNANQIIQAIREAEVQQADLVVFPELALSGYPPRDLLYFDAFMHEVQNALVQIAEACTQVAAVVGTPLPNPSAPFHKAWNAAVVCHRGQILHTTYKSLLPEYDVFDEVRYFEPASSITCFTFKNTKIALTICEDAWMFPGHEPYAINPVAQLAQEKPELLINISASPFHPQQNTLRQTMMRHHCQTHGLWGFYINQVGAQTDLIFDGGSFVMNPKGELVAQLPFFETAISTIPELTNSIQAPAPARIQHIHDALVLGIRDYFAKTGFKGAILGLSGGIDSAVTAALAVEALGAANVWGVLLPSHYSSDHSITDALALAHHLNIQTQTLPIRDGYETTLKAVAPYFNNTTPGLAEENIQARLRGVYLMAIANKHNKVLLNTSNKSEAAVGYGTLYGDMCGGISVLGDVFKTDVYQLAHYINRNGEVIPYNTITKPPSAELRPDQKDSDSLPEYDVLDAILKAYLEAHQSSEAIISQGFQPEVVRKVFRLVNLNEYKRYQTAPILRVSPKAFGTGRRMPVVGAYPL